MSASVVPSTGRKLQSRSEEFRARLRGAFAREPNCAILESGPGFGEIGRYSLFAVRPRGVFSARAGQWRLTPDWPGRRPADSATPLAALRFLLNQTRGPAIESFPFAGGWIGLLGYDLAPLIEKLPRRHPPATAVPDIHLGYFDSFVLLDRAADRLQIEAVDRFDEGPAARRERIRRLESMVAGAVAAADPGGPLIAAGLQSHFAPDEYCERVERILEYIRAGDIFQANFSHRFEAPFSGAIEVLYDRCARQTPAPFAALVRGHGWSVASTSPERFFLLQPDRRVETRPIKGTRPRGRDAVHDLLLKCELADSPKDRAELTMIVDLERNDLGRVCDFGSVRVARHAAVESYANVHHLVSTVVGRLHQRYDAVDLLRAMFPGGSITGAPKIRAMQIIDELERARRGVYTGAIGYFSDHGRADFNIAIRTLVVEGQTVHFHVGGGIVADSDPLAEYRETLAKGRKLREVLEGTG